MDIRLELVGVIEVIERAVLLHDPYKPRGREKDTPHTRKRTNTRSIRASIARDKKTRKNKNTLTFEIESEFSEQAISRIENHPVDPGLGVRG